MIKTATLGGLDISSLVTSWGDIERTKNLILGQDELFVSEHTIILGNKGHWGDPGGAASSAKGMDWSGEVFELLVDGRIVFSGTVVNLKPGAVSQEVRLVAQNRLKAAAEETVAVNLSAVNPGAVMLAALDQTHAKNYIDRLSFMRAGMFRENQGVLLNANYPQGQNHTALEVLQDVGDLASISVLEEAGKITASAFQPYQGSGAGLGFPITDAIARDWDEWERDPTAYKNRVKMGYPTDAYETLDDLESQKRNQKIIRSKDFSAGGPLVAAGKGAALALGQIYLSRSALRRATTRVTGGPQLVGTQLGDRFPITSVSLSVSGYPVETIGIRLALDDENVQLTLAQIA